MYKFFTLLFSLFLFSSVHAESSAEKYLENRIQKGDKRYLSFLIALELLSQANAKVLVETGTSRNGDLNFWGDGGSTIIFGHWAKDHDALLHSVDITNWAIENAQKATQAYAKNIHFTLGDSLKFLDSFYRPIDFLYLDSYDFDVNNPQPSQEHHLKEITMAFPLLHDKSIVMVDDCDLPFGGKGTLMIDFLLARGWKIVYKGYQTILVKGKE